MTAMQACNDAAVAACASRKTCTAANDAALNALKDAGLGTAIRHRIGHGMGLEGHEAPWLSPGDPTQIQTNMVFSNEPGVYRPDIDGYRTINTMIVTETGVDIPSRFQTDTPINARVIAI
jgi:Xaa-Pro aminopeptidase